MTVDQLEWGRDDLQGTYNRSRLQVCPQKLLIPAVTLKLVDFHVNMHSNNISVALNGLGPQVATSAAYGIGIFQLQGKLMVDCVNYNSPENYRAGCAPVDHTWTCASVDRTGEIWYTCVYVKATPDGGPTTIAIRRNEGYVHLECDFSLPNNAEAAIAAGISRTQMLPDLEMDHSMLLTQIAWIVVKASIASHPHVEAQIAK